MMFKSLLSAAAALVLSTTVAACAVDTTPDEPLGESYELLEGTERNARCVDRPMRRDIDDRISCRAIEVSRRDAEGRCECNTDGRRELSRAERDNVLREVERDERTRDRDLGCACELRQVASRDDARRCEQDRGEDLRNARGERIDGWCGEVDRGVDDGLDRCDGHGIRMVGAARLRANAEILIRCDASN